MSATPVRVIRIMNDNSLTVFELNISSSFLVLVLFQYVHTLRSEQETLCAAGIFSLVKLCCGAVFKTMVVFLQSLIWSLRELLLHLASG